MGCLVENMELELAPKSLELGLHLPCGNTRRLPNFPKPIRPAVDMNLKTDVTYILQWCMIAQLQYV